MTNEFAVIGHHRDDVEALLLLGADGRYYRYHLSDNHLDPVEPQEGWVLEPGVELLEMSSAAVGTTPHASLERPV